MSVQNPFVERKWLTVGPLAFTANGTTGGIVTVADASFVFVKQIANLTATGQPNLQVEVKRILSPTSFVVGLTGTNINTVADISAYTVAASASFFAGEQDRNRIDAAAIARATYMEEPAVAIRVLNVDPFGRSIDSIVDGFGVNRLAVDAALTLGPITLSIDALNPPTQPSPSNLLLVGTTDGTEGGLKVPMRASLDGYIQNLQQNALVKKVYDAIAAAYPTSTQEVYSYYTGGLAGTLVNTVTVNYTTAAKDFVLNVAVT